LAYFSAPENTLSEHHVYHTSHHVLTIKTPSQNTHFPQNHPQKPLQKRQNGSASPPAFF